MCKITFLSILIGFGLEQELKRKEGGGSPSSTGRSSMQSNGNDGRDTPSNGANPDSSNRLPPSDATSDRPRAGMGPGHSVPGKVGMPGQYKPGLGTGNMQQDKGYFIAKEFSPYREWDRSYDGIMTKDTNIYPGPPPGALHVLLGAALSVGVHSRDGTKQYTVSAISGAVLSKLYPSNRSARCAVYYSGPCLVHSSQCSNFQISDSCISSHAITM